MNVMDLKYAGLKRREIYLTFLAIGTVSEASGLPLPLNNAEEELYKLCQAKTDAAEEAQAAATAAEAAQTAAEAAATNAAASATAAATAKTAAETAQAAAETAQAAAEAAANPSN